jgi:hypothetical protein
VDAETQAVGVVLMQDARGVQKQVGQAPQWYQVGDNAKPYTHTSFGSPGWEIASGLPEFQNASARAASVRDELSDGPRSPGSGGVKTVRLFACAHTACGVVGSREIAVISHHPVYVRYANRAVRKGDS